MFIIQKEFLQIFRNRAMLPIIFAVPVIQLIILVHAATFEIKNIDIVVIDQDLSGLSKNLTKKFEGSSFFNLRGVIFDTPKAQKLLEEGKIEVYLNIHAGFEKQLMTEQQAKVGIFVDAVNSRNAGLISGYILNILQNYNGEILGEILPDISGISPRKKITVHEAYWYNPELNYKNFMVPGILVILVTLIGMFLSAMNIVREKEIGTIEQLNVTPIGKFQFIIGKLVPFMLLGLLEFSIGLAIGKVGFHIPIEGSLVLIYSAVVVFLFAVLAIGLLISTVNDTQQQALLVAYFFMMLFLLMSGLFTPVEGMPLWAHWLNIINPVAYFLKINRMIIMKGSGLMDIKTDLLSLFALGFVIFNLAVIRYKKTA
jgi:ABC-2 type transport system permease protein